MQFELFDGFYFYGILIRHKTDKKLPLVISQHGGLGTPEICCSFFDSANYNDMSERIFDKGVNVFAPQLDLWQEERFGPSGKRNDFDMKLKQLGGSIAALEIYSVMRCIDYFEKADYCNGKFGMAGLSYGGFYTMYRIEQHSQVVSDIRIGKKLDLNILFLVIIDWNLCKPLTDTDLCQLVLQREAVTWQR